MPKQGPQRGDTAQQSNWAAYRSRFWIQVWGSMRQKAWSLKHSCLMRSPLVEDGSNHLGSFMVRSCRSSWGMVFIVSVACRSTHEAARRGTMVCWAVGFKRSQTWKPIVQNLVKTNFKLKKGYHSFRKFLFFWNKSECVRFRGGPGRGAGKAPEVGRNDAFGGEKWDFWPGKNEETNGMLQVKKTETWVVSDVKIPLQKVGFSPIFCFVPNRKLESKALMRLVGSGKLFSKV